MKAFTVAAIIGGVLTAGPVLAQEAPAQTAPASQAAAQTSAPVAKFPEGARYAFINIQQIAAESADGKAAGQRIEDLRTKKANELNEKNKAIEANQAKLRSAVMTEDARALVQKDIDKTQLEIQRMSQDAQTELQELQNELTLDFQRKLGPVISAVAQERGLQLLFSQGDSGLVWADPGLDLTAEVIRRFDAATSAAAPKP